MPYQPRTDKVDKVLNLIDSVLSVEEDRLLEKADRAKRDNALRKAYRDLCDKRRY